MFLEGLGEQAEVWALSVRDKSEALALEKVLRSLWSETLDLDGMVRRGLFRQTMTAWRQRRSEVADPLPPQQLAPSRAVTAGAAVARESRRARSDVETKLGEVEDWVRRAFDTLADAAASASARDESGPGRRLLSSSGATICRLHPKIAHLAVGFPNSRREEVERSGLLRPQKDAAWINIARGEDVALAEILVRAAPQ